MILSNLIHAPFLTFITNHDETFCTTKIEIDTYVSFNF